MSSAKTEATLDGSIDEPGKADEALADLDIRALLGEAWALFRAQPTTYLLAALILIGAGALSLGVLLAPLLVGFIRMTEAHRRGETIEPGRILDGLPALGPALLTGLMIGVSVTLGTIALIIPGVVIGVMWSFALHFVALRDASAIEALRASWALGRRQIGSVLLVLLTALALTSIGSVVIVGVVVAMPVSLILLTLSFHELND